MRHFFTPTVVFISVVSLVLTAGCGAKKEERPPADTSSVTVGGAPGQRAPGAGPPETPGTSLVSRLAYSARVYKERGASHYDIFIIDGDDPTPRRLTGDSAQNTRPIWSPDGSRIAYLSETNQGVDIYVCSARERQPRRITKNPLKDVFPEVFLWPEEKEIYFATQSPGNNAILVWVIDPATGNCRKYADLPRGAILKIKLGGKLIPAIDPWYGGVAVSADGRKIARLINGGMKVSCTAPDGVNICEIPLAELAGRRVALGPWSPDSNSFIITQPPLRGMEGDTPPRILVADIPTRAVRAVAEGTDPVWSADGTFLIYTSPRTRIPFHDLDRGDMNVWNTELCLVRAAGGQPIRLTSEPSACSTPAVFARNAPESVIDFSSAGAAPPAVSTGGGETHMAPQPQPRSAGIALHLIGEFTAKTGFTRLQSRPGGSKAVVVAAEIPPTDGQNCEITVYALREGRYVKTETRLGKISQEEEKYERKCHPNNITHIGPEERRLTVGTDLAENTSIRFAGECDILPARGKERLVIYAVHQADSRWQTFLAIYQNEGGGWKQATSMALLSGSGELPHVNTNLKDVNADGSPELLVSHTITLPGGWRENFKIFKITNR